MHELLSSGRMPSTPPGTVPSVSFSGLSDRHRAYLNSCGLSDPIIDRRPYLTLIDQWRDALMKKYGMSEEQVSVEGILIPRRHPNGDRGMPQIRLDEPRIDRNGKRRKYDAPVGSGGILDVHPVNLEHINATSRRLWVCESLKGADALASRGELSVGMHGCWGWSVEGKLSQGFDLLPLEAREVIIAVDSDCAHENRAGPSDPRTAVRRLVLELRRRYYANVLVCIIPDAEDGSKSGMDDYLASLDSLGRY
jgi:hypothetical protein